MLLVNNTFSSAIRYRATETQNTQTVAPADTDSSSEVNTTLLKASFAIVLAPGRAGKLEQIRAILNQHGLDTSAEDFSKSKLSGALAKLTTLAPSVDGAEAIVSQQQQVKTTALADIQRAIATTRTKANYAFSQFAATGQKAVQAVTAEQDHSDGKFTTQTSYAELWAATASAIAGIKSDYVDFYADLMQKYTQMYQFYNDHVQKGATIAVDSGKDANHVNYYSDAIRDAYDAFNAAVTPIDLGSVKNWEQMTPAERNDMAETLKPAFEVDTSSGKITFNLEQYHSSPDYPTGVTYKENKAFSVSTATYQAWLASFNAVGSGLQSNMQSFAQRYSQANSTFDNLNKVLSGTISSLADSAKDVLKALS